MPVSRRDRSKRRSIPSIVRSSFEVLEPRRLLTGTVATWTGAGSDSLFSDANNWAGDIAPTSGQDLDFPAGVANTTVTLGSSVIVGNVEFEAAYTVAPSTGTASAIELDGSLTVTVGDVGISAPVVLGQNAIFEANDAGLLDMTGVISDGGNAFGIDKQGNGEVLLGGSGETYTGLTSGDGGTLIDTAPLASAIAIHSGTTFYGSSSIASIAGNDGTFSPATFDVSTNTATPATLTVNNGIDFNSPSEATLAYDIGGTIASSKVVVTAGAIDLADTTFSGTIVNGYVPTAGDVITLVQNNTGTAVVGTFLNLPQGATTSVGGQSYTISYTGGTSHDDVTLTASGVSSTNPTITSSTSTASTHGYTINASVVATDTSAGGTAGLTYTWSATHVPSGGKTPTYNTNGKNSSGNVTARFYKDGTYILQCLVKDESGHEATADVLVVVGQKLTAIKLEPHGAKIAPKKKLQYVATALDQFGHPMRTPQTFAWSVPSGGGTITSTGLFTAGSKAEKIDIEAKDGTLAAIVAGTIT